MISALKIFGIDLFIEDFGPLYKIPALTVYNHGMFINLEWAEKYRKIIYW